VAVAVAVGMQMQSGAHSAFRAFLFGGDFAQAIAKNSSPAAKGSDDLASAIF
jgi:hypothetical protein